MRLWQRTLLIVAISAAALLGVLRAVQTGLMARGLEEIEIRAARASLQQALNVIDWETERLDRVVWDWASWDDTYEYVVARSPEYVEINLVSDSLMSMGLNVIAFVAPDGHTVGAVALDPTTGARITIPELDVHQLPLDTPWLCPTANDSVRGILQWRDGPFLFATRPILRSDNSGPVRGTLLMGRYVDDSLIADWANITGLEMTLEPLDSPGARALLAPADARIDAGEGLEGPLPAQQSTLMAAHIDLADVGTAHAYTLLRDITGQPVLALRLALPRDLHTLGRRTFDHLHLAAAAAILVDGLLLLGVIVRSVVRPVQRLAGDVRRLGEGVTSVAVSPGEAREVAELAGAINHMLQERKSAEDVLHERQRYLAGLADAARLLTAGPDLPLVPVLEAIGRAAGAHYAYVALDRWLPGCDLQTRCAGWSATGAPLDWIDLPPMQELLAQAVPGEALVHPDVYELRADARALLVARGSSAILLLPLAVDAQRLGVLALERGAGLGRWSAHELDLLHTSATDLAHALAHRRSDHLQTALYRIAELAHSLDDLARLYPAIHAIVAELMPADNFYLALHDPVVDTLHFPYFVDQYEQSPGVVPVQRGITDYVLKTGQPMLAPIDVIEQMVREGKLEQRGAPALDWLGVPLRSKRAPGQAIGVIAVQSYTAGVRFGPDDLRMLSFVSSEIASAIESIRAEQALRESEARHRAIFETTGTPMAILAADTTVVLANDQFARLVGSTREALEGKRPWTDFAHADDLPRMLQYHHLRRSMENVVPRTYEARLVDSWGRVHDCEITVQLIAGTDRSVASVDDITERKRDQVRLAYSERRYRGLFEESPVALWLEDWSGLKQRVDELGGPAVLPARLAEDPGLFAELCRSIHVVDVNRAAIELYRAPSHSALLSNLQYVLNDGEHEGFRHAVLTLFGGERHAEHETRSRTLDGEPLYVRVRMTVTADAGATFSRVLVAVSDLTASHQAETQRQELQDQLREAQKMEAVGLLAGGVAHQFNNMLTVIQGNAELGELVAPSDPSVTEQFAVIRRTAVRAAHLTRQLLAFGRRQLLQPAVLDANAVVESFTNVAQPLVGETIQVTLDLAPGPLLVVADRNALEQALSMLALSARDAMAATGGRLTLATHSGYADDAYCQAHPEAEPGDFVQIVVQDTGAGIEPSLLDRVFEPFFSTQSMGAARESAGIGLAVVYGILRQHRGWVKVHSRIGQGTRFELHLPAYDPVRTFAGSAPGSITSPATITADDSALQTVAASDPHATASSGGSH